MAAQPMVEGGSTRMNRDPRQCGPEVESREETVRKRSAKHCCMRISQGVCIGNRVPIYDAAKPFGRAIDPGVHRLPAVLPMSRSRARETCTKNERWKPDVQGDFYSRLHFAIVGCAGCRRRY